MSKEGVICPFCGEEMIWQSDFMSEELGYEDEGKIVEVYSCPKCGCYGEFVEGSGCVDEDNQLLLNFDN